MEGYCKHYVDLALTVKRKKKELDAIRAKLKDAKSKLYSAMVKNDIEDVMYHTRVNGEEERIHLVRDKLQPKPPSKRKKKAEIQEDILVVLENHKVDNPEDLVREIELARKAKGEAAPSKTGKVGYGDVIYQ